MKKSVPPTMTVKSSARSAGRSLYVEAGDSRLRSVSMGLGTDSSEKDSGDDCSALYLDSIPRRKSQARPKVNKPAHRDVPESRASPARIPAGISLRCIHIAQANSRKVTARMVPPARRERATSAGSI